MEFGIWRILDLSGTAVFAFSGALAASGQRMDVFGITIIATVTAVGGGTIRDALLGAKVFWLTDSCYFFVSFVAALFCCVLLRKGIKYMPSLLVKADAVGLGVFTVIGIERSQQAGVSCFAVLLLGMVTGAGGGIIRDILCARIPVVLQKEIYACASLLGGVVYIFLSWIAFPDVINIVVALAVVYSIRMFTLNRRMELPVL